MKNLPQKRVKKAVVCVCVYAAIENIRWTYKTELW